jgi:hypothetical protein
MAVLVWFLPSASLASAGYLSGTLLDIQKNIQTTPRVWLWDTVVAYSETVSYQLRIRVGNLGLSKRVRAPDSTHRSVAH